MKKIALIMTFAFVFAVAMGYAGQANAASAASLADQVIEKGIKKQDCAESCGTGCGKEIYEFTYNQEVVDVLTEQAVFTVVVQEKKVQKSKKKFEIVKERNLSITYSQKKWVTVILDGEEAGKVLVEKNVFIQRDNVDGVYGWSLDKLTYVKTEAGKILVEVNFDKGVLSIKGISQEAIQSWTGAGVGAYFSRKIDEFYDLLRYAN